MTADSAEYREKHTAINSVLPSVGELANGKPTILRYVDINGREQQLDYRHLLAADPFPIPMPVDREGYGTVENSHHYWATGHGDWLNVVMAIRRYLHRTPIRLLDFGCATGRFLRHAFLFGRLEVHGCDFAPANIRWVQKHLPAEIQVALNSTQPTLPYPDNWFDITTAFSVFTHLDDGWENWLKELNRITKPDGLLYLTIKNEASWQMVPERPSLFQHLLKANQFDSNLTVNEELFQRPMPNDRVVFRMSQDDVYNCNVWLKNQFIEQHWSRFLDVKKIADTAHARFQSCVIANPR